MTSLYLFGGQFPFQDQPRLVVFLVIDQGTPKLIQKYDKLFNSNKQRTRQQIRDIESAKASIESMGKEELVRLFGTDTPNKSIPVLITCATLSDKATLKAICSSLSTTKIGVF